MGPAMVTSELECVGDREMQNQKDARICGNINDIGTPQVIIFIFYIPQENDNHFWLGFVDHS